MDELVARVLAVPETVAFVRDALEQGDYEGLLDPARLDSYLLPLILFGALVMLLAALLHAVFIPSATTAKEKKPRERHHPDTRAVERLLTWLFPPADPLRIGHIVVNLRWLPHVLVFGAPGSGKSTFMMQRILDTPAGLVGALTVLCWSLSHYRWPRRQRRAKLIVTANFSAPFRVACLWLLEHWPWLPVYIWTPNPIRGETFGLDLLEGPPDNVGARIIAMVPLTTNNTGLQSGSVEGMIVDTVIALDLARETRTFGAILRTIRGVGIRDVDDDGRPIGAPRQLTTQERTGLENWCTRLRTLQRRMGASVGGDLRLSHALRNGYVVLVECSSYNNPTSTEPLMNLFVYLCMWLVVEVGDFDLLIDEAGGVPPETFVKLLSATREPNVRIVIGAQSRKQVNDVLREMCNTILLLGCAGGSPEAREFASKAVDGDIAPEDFVLLDPKRAQDRMLFFLRRRGLRSCEGYLFSNGRLDRVRASYCDRSILSRYSRGSLLWPGHGGQEPGSVAPSFQALPTSVTWREGEGVVVVPEAGAEDVPDWLPRHDGALVRIYHNVEVVREHRLSLYRKVGRPPGRPMLEYPNGVTWYPYALLKAVRDGLDLDEVKQRLGDKSASGLTYHHRCRELDPALSAEDEYRCQNPDHGEWMTRGGNTAIAWRNRERRLRKVQ